MDLNTAGHPIMLIAALGFVLFAGIALDHYGKGMALFFGLLSVNLTVLFCTAQILKQLS